jgi:D-xylose transport system permease protein
MDNSSATESDALPDAVTGSDTGSDSPAPPSAAERAVSDFGIDTTARTTAEALHDYLARVRGGELGSLPALLGLVVLVGLFGSLSPTFLTLGNLANLLAQGAGVTIIAMGLVFVLLLGEIDLAAGTASGVTAAVLALHLVAKGNLLGGMGTLVFVVFCVLLLAALGLGLLLRLWAAAAAPLVALLIALLGVGPNPWVEMLLAICVGTSIGVLTGFLVSRIGIPSFVVTLALFLAWQGVILQFIGSGGVLALQNDTLFAVANGNLPVAGSWLLCVVAVLGYAAVLLGRHFHRIRHGLVTQPTPLILTKVGVTVVLALLATALLTLNRSQSNLIKITGVPYVVPIVLVLLVAGTYVLDRTRYGRHIYAVGGNAEAARRAGINVPRIRASVFVVSTTLAAVGAIVYSSKVGSVDPNAGGGTTLLYAVGAAVIGGTSLFGGRGRLSNAVIGGAVLAVVNNGLGLLKQPASTVLVVTGIVLLLAATVDALSRRRSPVAR